MIFCYCFGHNSHRESSDNTEKEQHETDICIRSKF